MVKKLGSFKGVCQDLIEVVRAMAEVQLVRRTRYNN